MSRAEAGLRTGKQGDLFSSSPAVEEPVGQGEEEISHDGAWPRLPLNLVSWNGRRTLELLDAQATALLSDDTQETSP